MPYDIQLATRIRQYLIDLPYLAIEEKKMFGGLAFLVNGKMCINVSGDNMMCRVDPALQYSIAEKRGVQPVVMKGRELKGYYYIHPVGFQVQKDFEYWIDLCLDYNKKAKSSGKTK